MSERKLNEPATKEDSLERIANLLAMMAVKDYPQAEQILILRGVGYSPAEIAQLLNVTPNTVSVAIYRAKNKGRRSKSK